MFLFRSGRRAEALEHARRALASAPQDVLTRYAAATAEMIAGSEPRAIDIFEQLLPTLGQHPDWHVHAPLARLYRRAGREKDAEKLLTERFEFDRRALAAGRRGYDLRLDRAFILAMRGEKEEAVKAIEAAMDQGWRGYSWHPRWYPLFEPLRGDPRFESLMDRVEKNVSEMRHRASAS